MENLKNLHDFRQQNIRVPKKAPSEKPIKVKFISNPMLVKANSESEFRAIVQRLTGQHSADDAFESPQEHNHLVFDRPPPSMAAPAAPKDCYGSVSGDVYAPVGLSEGGFWRDEMEGSFSGFKASCVDTW